MYIFLYDARRFTLKSAQIIDAAPLQLYSSGLIFAPHRALIRENFKRELPAWLFRGPKVEEYWNPEMQTLEGHYGSVYSVAFSGDGQLLASGSYDKTIKLWDPTTGALKHNITTDGVITNVEFSEHLPLLTTNRGSFDIQIYNESFSSNSSKKVTEISLGVDRWVSIQGQRELWLPPNYQPSFSTIKDSIIALGSTSGRIAIIAFSVM